MVNYYKDFEEGIDTDRKLDEFAGRKQKTSKSKVNLPYDVFR